MSTKIRTISTEFLYQKLYSAPLFFSTATWHLPVSEQLKDRVWRDTMECSSVALYLTEVQSSRFKMLYAMTGFIQWSWDLHWSCVSLFLSGYDILLLMLPFCWFKQVSSIAGTLPQTIFPLKNQKKKKTYISLEGIILQLAHL